MAALPKSILDVKISGESLIYQNSQEYVETFLYALKEAIANTIPSNASIAAEFSAGLDSTAVYCAAHEHGLRPKLFMHSARWTLTQRNVIKQDMKLVFGSLSRGRYRACSSKKS